MSEQLSIGAVMALPTKVTDQFEEFWKAYPKRPNNPKHTARLSWVRARQTATVAEIMAGLARYQFDAEPRHRPMASTWLNQRRFEINDDALDADAYGLSDWLLALPRDGSLSATAYDIDELRAVLVATGWPADWRGSLEILGEWMRDGFAPSSCAQVIASAVAEFGPRSTLIAFNKRVRHRAMNLVCADGRV